MNDATTIQALAGTLMTLLFATIVTGAGWAWVRFFVRRGQGQSLLEYESRRPVPWGLIDLLVIGLIFFVIQVLAMILAMRVLGLRLTSDEAPTGIMLLSAIASLLTGLVAVGYLRWRTDANSHDLGELPWRPRRDVLDALTVFLLVIVPVFSVQFILSQFFAPEHPLIKTLLENPSLDFFIVGGFLAVIVAPAVEEYLFRVILQGWLENVAYARAVGPSHFDSALLLGIRHRGPVPRGVGEGDMTGVDPPHAPSSKPEIEIVVPQLVRRAADLGAMANPYRSPPLDVPTNPSSVDVSRAVELPMTSVKPARWPIVVSSIVFALAHFGHAADPIPLFLFALGLGWLYQKTHRVWPCILVHMLLNGLTMIQLGVYVIVQP